MKEDFQIKVLGLLGLREISGPELCKALKVSGGDFSYKMLRMEDNGYVKSRLEIVDLLGQRATKHFYTATAKGRELLEKAGA